MSVSAPSSVSRRHDLDWLRVIAFAILIFYHIGMFYVTWDWHVKSPHAGTATQGLMMAVNPWRLALLFLISGIALRFVTDKGRLLPFAGRRSLRLFLPILFGMLVVVAPQAYFELRQAGVIEAGYGAFYRGYLSFDPAVMRDWGLIMPTWNHLWYVVYLLVYTWIVLLLIVPLRMASRWLERLTGPSWLILLVPAIPFVIYRFTVDPQFETTHNLVWDWANHAHRLTILLLGFVLAKNAGFWRAVDRMLPWTVGLSVLSISILSYFWQEAVWSTLTDGGAAMTALRAWRILYAWWVILALLGLAQRFLTRPSAVLAWANDRVFAWYILHQTITVAAGYYLAQSGLAAWPEFLLLTAATVAGALGGAELVRAIPVVRAFFGFPFRLSGTARDAEPRPTLAEAPASSSGS